MNTIRRIIRNFLFKHLYNGITDADVLKVVGGSIFLNGKPLSNQQRNGIITEAQNIKGTALWKLLCDEIRLTANKKLYLESSNVQDMLSPKMALWVVDLMERKIQKLGDM